MTTPTTLNPFPSPAPRSDKLIDPMQVRGNDNLLAQKINEVIDYVGAIPSGDVVPNGGTNEEAVADRELRNTLFDILQVLEDIKALLEEGA